MDSHSATRTVRQRTSPPAKRPRVRAALAVVFACAFASGGCAARRHSEALEARLRQQEDRLVDVHRELIAARRERDLARAEVDQLRLAANQRGEQVLLPEQSAILAKLEGIRLGSLLTGGLDQDGRPGDDALTVMVVPHDADGELVKIPGTLEVEVLDLSRADARRIVGQWSFGPDEARELWHRGFVGHGYRLVLPWQQTPASPELIVHARFKTLDGRTFDDTQSVTIQPPSAASQQPPAPPSISDRRRLNSRVLPASATIPAEETDDGWQADVEFNQHDAPARPNASPPAASSGGGNPFDDAAATDEQNPFLSEVPQRTSDAWTEHSIPSLR